MTPVLLNSMGRPEPSPEIQRRLAAITPGMKLQWLEGIGQNWAVTLKWRDGDRRWQWVQEQKYDVDRTFDIIGYLPKECPVDQAAGYLEKMMRTYPREDVHRMANAVNKWNDEEAGKADVEKAVAEILDSPDPSRMVQKKRGRPRKES